MQAKDIMTSPVVTVTPETLVSDVAKRLLDRRISAVPVIDEHGMIVGIVSEGDLMRRPESNTMAKTSWWLAIVASSEAIAEKYVKTHGHVASDVMTRDVITVSENATLADIATILERHRIKRVPVVREGKPIGIVSRANLLRGLVASSKAPAVTENDASIRAAVEAALNEAHIGEGSLNVIVAGGIVQVWGTATSEAEKDAIRVAIENIPGVKSLDNHVAVFPAGFVRGGWA